MKRVLAVLLTVAGASGAYAQWPAKPVEPASPVEAQLEDTHLELMQSKGASELREEAKRERREYAKAVNSGPEIAAVTEQIGLVAEDLQTAQASRNQKMKAAARSGQRNAANDAEIEGLNRDVAQLRTELRSLLEQRRKAVRANRAAQVEKKAEVDAAEAAYRAAVYDAPAYEGLMEQKQAADAAEAVAGSPMEETSSTGAQ